MLAGVERSRLLAEMEAEAARKAEAAVAGASSDEETTNEADTAAAKKAAKAEADDAHRAWLDGLVAGSEVKKTDSLLRENGLFLSFPYVCPEPVLAKR